MSSTYVFTSKKTYKVYVTLEFETKKQRLVFIHWMLS